MSAVAGSEVSVATLSDEIEAFQGMQRRLEIDHMGLWVLIHDRRLVGAFDTFQLAADDAVRKFGSGPFLIRQVGTSTLTLPISVMYPWPNAER